MILLLLYLSVFPLDYYPLAKGNCWTYVIHYQYEDARELRLEVMEKTDTGFVLESPDETQTLRFSGDTLWVTRQSNYAVETGPDALLVGPLKKGTAWDWAGGRAWVSGTEDIAVTAGHFSCVRIERRRKFTSGPMNMDEEITEWWAMGVGMVKKKRVLKGETGTSGWTWELVDCRIR